MSEVPTVRGPVDTSLLGPTLMHEHIFVLSPEINENYPETVPEVTKLIEDAVVRLNELHATGIGAIVDLTVIGLGRSIARIQKVAERTPLHILVATGIYTYRDLPLFFQYRDPKDMPKLFIRDLTEGIANTGVRAAILKCATDRFGLTRDVERVVRAVAAAHRETGAPISTHTHAASRSGLDQQRVFREEKVDLTRVVIGHSGDTTDLDYLEEVMREGSYIGMDRFGIGTILKFEDRVDTVARLCERGWAKQMVLSHDAACYNDWLLEGWQTILPQWHYLHIHSDVLPALRARGVTEEQIQTMLVENPRRFFSR
jgi:phosphotriesterase-related protein